MIEGEFVSDNKNKEKVFDFINDSVDIGKEPMPITDPKIKEAHDKIINKYKRK